MKKSQILLYMLKGKEITPRRALNFARNYAAMLMGRTELRDYPSVLMVEPTNYCNLRCPLCPCGSGALKVPRGYMKLTDFKKIIDECGPYLLNLTLWNWGEPFLNREVYDMIEYAKSKRIFVRVSTNGHLLKRSKSMERVVRSGMDELIFSLDGASKETFLKYRKSGDFEGVMRNLRNLIQTKRRLRSSTPFIELQFIVMRHNEHEIPEIKRIAGEVGVDRLKLKTVSLEKANALGFGGSREKIRKYKPSDERYSRYNSSIKRKVIRNRCVRLWVSSVVNWDGTVSPCCNDPNRVFNFGNALDAGFMQVWNSPRYASFRKAILSNKVSIEMCRNCSGELMGLDVE